MDRFCGFFTIPLPRNPPFAEKARLMLGFQGGWAPGHSVGLIPAVIGPA